MPPAARPVARPAPSSCFRQCLLCWHWPYSPCSLTRKALRNRLQVESEVPSVESEAPPKARRNIRSTLTNLRTTPRPKVPLPKPAGRKSVEPEEEEESEEGQGTAGEALGQDGGNNPPRRRRRKAAPSRAGWRQGRRRHRPQPRQVGRRIPGHATSPNSSGGSSPVVPILIAVVVLAAISIGVVLYRQRKSGPGPDEPRLLAQRELDRQHPWRDRCFKSAGRRAP